MHLQADVQFQNKHLDAMKSARIGVECEKHQETSRPIEKPALATANDTAAGIQIATAGRQ